MKNIYIYIVFIHFSSKKTQGKMRTDVLTIFCCSSISLTEADLFKTKQPQNQESTLEPIQLSRSTVSFDWIKTNNHTPDGGDIQSLIIIGISLPRSPCISGGAVATISSGDGAMERGGERAAFGEGRATEADTEELWVQGEIERRRRRLGSKNEGFEGNATG